MPEILSRPPGGAENAEFTPDEQAEIARRMEAIKAYASEMPELTAEQVTGMEEKLDVLTDASKRVGRKDWLVMLYGAAFGMIVNDSVAPHLVQNIIAMTIHGLGHILGLGGMPPALPHV